MYLDFYNRTVQNTFPKSVFMCSLLGSSFGKYEQNLHARWIKYYDVFKFRGKYFSFYFMTVVRLIKRSYLRISQYYPPLSPETMNCEPKKYKQPAPDESSNILIKLLFVNAFKLLKNGYKTKILEDDLHEVPSFLKSRKLRTTLEQQKLHHFWLTLFKSFGLCYLSLGLMKLLANTLYLMIQPYLLQKIILYFTSNGKDLNKESALLYLLLLTSFSLIFCIFTHNYNFCLAKFALKVRTSISAYIYGRVLLGPQDNCMGHILTLVTKDVQIFESFVASGNEIWIGTVKMVVISYFLYQEVGKATAVVVAILAMFIIVQGLIGENVTVLMAKALEETDNRLQLTKAVFYTNQQCNVSSEKLASCRRCEVQARYKMLLLKSLSQSFGKLSTRLSFFALILTYMTCENKLTTATVLFILNQFQLLCEVVCTSFPEAVYRLSQLVAAITRLEDVVANFDSCTPSKLTDFEYTKGVTVTTETPPLILQRSTSCVFPQPWLFPSTVRQNILFGEKYDSKRYQAVAKICDLRKDLQMLEKSDATVVLDQGKNLSESLKVKINIARAVYKESDIYVFDGCFPDSVYERCVLKFLDGKVVILVKKGCHSFELPFVNEMPTVGSSVYSEGVSSGGVHFRTYEKYMRLGGSLPFVLMVFSTFILANITTSYSTNLELVWVNVEQIVANHTTTVSALREYQSTLRLCAFFILATAATSLISSIALWTFSKRVSLHVHVDKIKNLENAFMGSVLNKFSKDLDTIDVTIPFLFHELFHIFLELLGLVTMIIYLNMVFIIPLSILIAILVTVRRCCLPALRNLKRLDSATKAPVVGHLNSTIDGLPTIQTFQVGNKILDEFDSHLDSHTSANYFLQLTSKSFDFLTDVCCNVYITITIFVLLFVGSGNECAFAVTQTYMFTGILHKTIKSWTDVEVQMTAFERFLGETEKKTFENGGFLGDTESLDRGSSSTRIRDDTALFSLV